ncbi:RNA methyltransferase tRNA(m5U54)methyltransferase [Schaereria dolodes]|nr:RNA methyltransferase tRNA(m5U54)methyltransferase [Schaereria dolodes]
MPATDEPRKQDEKKSKKKVVYDGQEYEVIREGLAEILNQETTKSTPGTMPIQSANDQSQTVFYNPIQQFNRDLSVLAIRAFGEDLAVIRKARHRRRLLDLGRKEPQRRKRNKEGGCICGDPEGKKRKRDENDSDGENLKREGSVDAKVDGVAENKDAGITTNQLLAFAESVAVKKSVIHGANATQHVPTTGSALEEPYIEGIHEYAGVPVGPRHPSKASRTPSGTAQNGIKTEYPQSMAFKQENNHSHENSFRILDALSATGLRALRYAKETSATSVTANDLSSSATTSIKLNVRHNGLTDKVHVVTGNALTHMYDTSGVLGASPKCGRKTYDVIDLDPYGTAAPFLDAAVQALNDGGMLCVTCTDAGIFASVGYLEKTYSQYGGLPFKGLQSHEAGLRLILHAIATSAARYGLAIEPLLSLSIDFYARIFVRIRRSPAEVKFLAGKTMLVFNCDAGCGAWTTQFLAQNRTKKDKKDQTFYTHSLGLGPTATPYCDHCGFKTHLSGPMWGGPLHNPYFIQRILDDIPALNKEIYATIPRIEGMLSLAMNETLLSPNSEQSPDPPDPSDPRSSTFPRLNPAVPDHHPFFVIPSTLAKVIHCVAPSDAAFRGALLSLGYRVMRSHTKPGSTRTDAPWHVIWEVMREWVRQKSPIKNDAVKKGTAGWGIMSKDRAHKAVWTLKEELRTALENVDDMKEAKTEIEAALFRAGKMSDGLGGGSNVGDGARDDRAALRKSCGNANDLPDTSKLKIVFDENLGRETGEKKLVRYQVNPRANWGPMSRAKGVSGI